ncbi:MAG: CRISPR-associated endonuclease Cas1, partial [Anaerolineae bacterium]|nr:CRISPR-associated endonuclease Cas1 [Anaerolineae bacterium]
PDLLPARMINEFAYCPRLAYLEWVQGDWEDNADTAEGRFAHRVVNQPSGDLPDPAEIAAEVEPIHARSVWLSAPNEGLTARIDLIEGEGTVVTPVDYKRGAAPDLPEGAWEADRVQLCAQGLILRENGFTCDRGVIYYAASKTRVTVPFDDALVARTRELAQGLREMAARGQIPPPLEDSPKCLRCSLAPICLPDEVNWLRTPEAERQPLRRVLPRSDDAAPLYVQTQGARVTKRGEVFEVWLKDERLAEARIAETSHIALFGGVNMTVPALNEAFDRGIVVSFFTYGGWFKGIAHGPAHKNVALRIAQYRAAFDPQRCLKLARAFVASKVRNARTLLMRNHINPPKDTLEALKNFAQQAAQAPSLEVLLGIEGNAARAYFSAFSGMLKPKGKASWAFDFNSRNRRPPTDPVNALLSFTYALLAKELTVLAHQCGFDPFLGFYHQPHYGRPALALDVMETFRPLIADSVVLTVINTGVVTPQDFVRAGPSVALSPSARKAVIEAFEARLRGEITHPLFGYRISYRRVLEVQLRLLGRWLQGEIDEYPQFLTR